MMWTNTKDCVSTNVSILVYGESGAGKTTLANTIKGTPLIINAESGLRSIKDSGIAVYDVTKDDNGNDLDRKHRWEKLDSILNELVMKKELKEKFNWIVLDSLTEISQNLVEMLKEKHEGSNNGYAVWGDYNNMMTDLLKRVRDMSHYNSLFICLDSVDQDENGVRFTGLDIQGKISRRIPALFDEVFYLKKFTDEHGEEQRTLVTSTYKNIVAKDRSTKLEQFEAPDIGMIYDKINS